MSSRSVATDYLVTPDDEVTGRFHVTRRATFHGRTVHRTIATYDSSPAAEKVAAVMRSTIPFEKDQPQEAAL